MSSYSEVLIIGTGLAGYSVAKEFRRYHSEASLMLMTKSAGDFYAKPALSNALKHHKTADDLPMSDAAAMADSLKATILTHKTVKALDISARRVSLADHHEVAYGKLVLACGSYPIRLPLAGDAASAVLSVNHLEDYRVFRQAIEGKQHIAIIGAGLIGCEFANDLVDAGYQVTVIAMDNHPIERLLPFESGMALQRALANKGVAWRMQSQVETVNQHQGRYRLELKDSSVLTVDCVLSAVGLRPNTDLAAAGGMAIHVGVQVDRYLASSSPCVYALGDCAEVNGHCLYFIAPLRRCAMALAKTLSGEPTAVAYPAMPVVVKTPACPTVVWPPSRDVEGQWSTTVSGLDTKALFYDTQNRLCGFALTGDYTKERGALTKLMPDLF